MTAFTKILSATVLGFVPLSAFALETDNHMQVNAVNDAVFEVIAERDGSGYGFWCAAAQYAEQELHASPQAKMYIVRGEGVSETTGRRPSVQFTIDPEAAGVTPAPLGEDVNDFNVGGTMEIGLARTQCDN